MELRQLYTSTHVTLKVDTAEKNHMHVTRVARASPVCHVHCLQYNSSGVHYNLISEMMAQHIVHCIREANQN